MSGPSFPSMSQNELVSFLVDHQDELAACGIAEADLHKGLAEGSALVEVREFGCAVVQVKDSGPHLWLLYIEPARRRHGLGKAFLRELVAKYGATHHMTLHCEGPERRRFFGSAGFVVAGKRGEVRFMTTDRSPYRFLGAAA